MKAKLEKINNNTKAFSLAEMMIVMLILSVLVAAALPIITKRIVNKKSSASSSSGIWSKTTNSENAIYPTKKGRIGIGTGSNIFETGEDAAIVLNKNSFNIKLSSSYTATYSQINIALMTKDNIGAVLNQGSNYLTFGYTNQFDGTWPSVQNTVIIGDHTFESKSLLSSGSGWYTWPISPPYDSLLLGYGFNISTSETEDASAILLHIYGDVGENTIIGKDISFMGKQNIVIGNNITLDYTSSPRPDKAVIIGKNAYANSLYGIAIGDDDTTDLSNGTMAVGENAVAIGTNAHALAQYSTAIGHNATATTANDFAFGAETSATDNAIAVGYGATAAGTGSDPAIAIGALATASGGGSIALGANSIASSTGAIALGKATAAGEYALAIGSGASASSNNAIAIGTNTNASGNNSVALGAGAISIDSDSITLGTDTDTVNMLAVVVYSTNDKYPTCDARLKNIKGESKDGLDKIIQLQPYEYTLKKDKEKKLHVSVIAQDLQKIFPNAVIKDKDGYLKIRDEDMFAAMINSVKQLDAMLTQIAKNIKQITHEINLATKKLPILLNLDKLADKEITKLEARNTALENRIKRLEKLTAK